VIRHSIARFGAKGSKGSVKANNEQWLFATIALYRSRTELSSTQNMRDTHPTLTAQNKGHKAFSCGKMDKGIGPLQENAQILKCCPRHRTPVDDNSG
jgi:hypothetical protein